MQIKAWPRDGDRKCRYARNGTVNVRYRIGGGVPRG